MTTEEKLGGSMDIRRVILTGLTALALALIVVTGALFRFKNLAWDDWKWIHPDETHMQQTFSKIHTPDEALVLSRMQDWPSWVQSVPGIRCCAR